MNIEIITKADLLNLKIELLDEIRDLFKGNNLSNKKWLKAAEVRKLLNISPNTLQTLRINGTIPYSKVGGITYYDYEDILKVMEKRKRNKLKE